MKTNSLKLFIILELSALLLISIIAIIGLIYQIPFPDLTANPVSLLKLPFYQGILQRIGIILWGGIVIIIFFTYFTLKESNNLNEIKKFLVFSGLFFGYLMIDELLLIHNHVFPKILNIHQLLILVIYTILTLLFLIRFRIIIINNFLWVIIIGISFLALSMSIDILSYLKVIKLTYRYLWDDSTKFLGIANIFIYYLFLCRMILIRKIKEFK